MALSTRSAASRLPLPPTLLLPRFAALHPAIGPAPLPASTAAPLLPFSPTPTEQFAPDSDSAAAASPASPPLVLTDHVAILDGPLFRALRRGVRRSTLHFGANPAAAALLDALSRDPTRADCVCTWIAGFHLRKLVETQARTAQSQFNNTYPLHLPASDLAAAFPSDTSPAAQLYLAATEAIVAAARREEHAVVAVCGSAAVAGRLEGAFAADAGVKVVGVEEGTVLGA
ncbi:uncharacterized protein LOC62_03G003740 [Vanrija pseudolonga]|uniref:Uncharacterized protein n=1 Tax=Vanrija pseudolonga TaxID=143232 RepID=A0AAF0YAV4_9TREE|nr:hypothetical protein LOC62_03G003740 [Vanrija pseudolonga]